MLKAPVKTKGTWVSTTDLGRESCVIRAVLEVIHPHITARLPWARRGLDGKMDMKNGLTHDPQPLTNHLILERRHTHTCDSDCPSSQASGAPLLGLCLLPTALPQAPFLALPFLSHRSVLAWPPAQPSALLSTSLCTSQVSSHLP